MENQFIEVYVAQYGSAFPTVQNPRICHRWAIIFMSPLPNQLLGVSYGAVGDFRMLQVLPPQRVSLLESRDYKGRCRIGRIASHVFIKKGQDSAHAKLLATPVRNDLPTWNGQDWVVDALTGIKDLGEFSKDLSVNGIQRKLNGAMREDSTSLSVEMMLKDMKLL